MIKICNLSCGYAGHEVIKNVSLNINEGDFVGIIGKNGVGKTTFLKSLAGLIKPFSGNVFIDDTDIYKIKKSVLAKKIAFMPQTMQFDFPFSVKDFIMFGRYPYMNMFKYASAEDFSIVREVMNFTGVAEFAERNISELSGGEKQKVLMAQTLSQRTDIIALDEPTSHLDIGSQSSIFKILRMLNEKYNKTVITTIHDLNLAGEFCSRLVLIDKGNIFNSGTCDEVLNYRDIENVYDAKVVVKTNPVSQKPVVIPIYADSYKKK
ncbi:MAG: ABC transporter ATP-binding protein [Endomicrobiaceae bacterium]